MLGILQDERVLLNDDDKHRLAGNLNVCYLGIEGKTIINSVPDRISISVGSACTTQNVEPFHVIMAPRILGRADTLVYTDISWKVYQ